MRIGIDNISPGLSSTRQALGGMRHFIQSLVTYLPKERASDEFILFTPEWADAFETSSVENLTVVKCTNVPQHRPGRVFYEQFILPGQIQHQEVAVWLGTVNTLPLRYSKQNVLFVQSLQYYTQPRSYPCLQRLYLRVFASLSIRRANRLVVFSQVSKDEMVRRLKIDPAKIAVIPHAVRFDSQSLVRENGPREQKQVAEMVSGGNYILCVSAFYPYKNLPRLITAFACLKPEYSHKLVICGAETNHLKRADLMALARQLGVDAEVIFLGRVPDEQLSMLYRQATMMAMPSLEETFGLPPLEAMAFGCPVLTSNLSSMQEVAGEAAMLVDPYSVESIADGLRQVLSDPVRRQEMAEAGRVRARLFTRERFFNQLMSVIDSVR